MIQILPQQWFTFHNLIGGDSRFFWPENIGNLAHFPLAWDNILNTGVGQSQLGMLWINSYLNLTAFISKLGIPWELVNLFFWVLPSLVISFFSSFFLFRYFFKNVKFSFLAGLIYSLNTYFLMILTGGQLGVAISYSLTPLVLLTFLRLLKKPTFKNSILLGLAYGFQILFDPRPAYISFIIVFLYSLFNLRESIEFIKRYLLILIKAFSISILLNSFWILPLLLSKTSPLPNGFSSPNGFEFFSFADFSHSLSLLHPNWPENIFGKVYFLRWEFLVLPIIAFGSLIFKKNKEILFFTILALLGVFLAKGINPPFGEINNFVFQHIPGMVMFRDPTKWYILIAISYSVLVPFTLLEISKKFKFQNLIFAGFILYFLFLSRSIVESHSLLTKGVPQEYVQLKNFLYSQNNFSRTLWIPEWQRFGYFDNNHPAIGRYEIFQTHDSQKIIGELKGDKNLLMDLGIKYVIIPYDSSGEIFINDRKYDEKIYQNVVDGVSKIGWLKLSKSFGKIKVFETSFAKDHFWSPSDNLKIKYTFVNSSEYEVRVKIAKKGDILVFSEGFEKNWIASGPNFDIHSSKFGNLNRFSLPDGNYELKVTFTPQKYVNYGLILSALTLLGSLRYLVIGFKK